MILVYIGTFIALCPIVIGLIIATMTLIGHLAFLLDKYKTYGWRYVEMDIIPLFPLVVFLGILIALIGVFISAPITHTSNENVEVERR